MPPSVAKDRPAGKLSLRGDSRGGFRERELRQAVLELHALRQDLPVEVRDLNGELLQALTDLVHLACEVLAERLRLRHLAERDELRVQLFDALAVRLRLKQCRLASLFKFRHPAVHVHDLFETGARLRIEASLRGTEVELEVRDTSARPNVDRFGDRCGFLDPQLGVAARRHLDTEQVALAELLEALSGLLQAETGGNGMADVHRSRALPAV